ncbi:hypothetical protein F0562_034722 [Nyssa sinensis]|uniref:Uncharacterized protein n=1 Tax=Nyssa sinensis TaxID=561372 RepID=A0A5J5A9C0_9ASTE|nr:hypothetical protein F0562_034722 [Nyssa sinensis]
MDDDDQNTVTHCPPVSFQDFSRVIHPSAQPSFLCEQTCRRESKGTGVFIPRSSHPTRKNRQGRLTSPNTKHQRQPDNSRGLPHVPIKGRHVFITGGSSGIGLALAHQAALEGARVSILARNRDKLEEAKHSIQLSTGIDVAVYSADVREFDAVKRAVEEAGPIDVLVCNQGVFVPQELESQELEEVKVGLIGGPASIAIMSSQAGQVGIYGYTAYSASKFGLRGMAEALQQEVIADNIHVSLIFPPDTETPGLLKGLELLSFFLFFFNCVYEEKIWNFDCALLVASIIIQHLC